MNVLEPLLVIALLGAVVWLISAPLRAGAAAADEAGGAQRADLEAAKETKYGEIREAELDRRTGKLSGNDWREVDRQLRAEAVEILARIDALGDTPSR
ncbi:MAG: hypothetical protein ABI950_12975 [Solirubrobacteraceae bacterium]